MVDGRIEGMCRGRDSGRGQRRTRTRTHDGRRTTDDEKAKRTKPGKTHRQSSLVINRASPSPPDALDHRATGTPCHWVPGRTPSASSRPAVHHPSIDIPQYYHIAVKHDWTQHQRMTNRLDRTDAQTPNGPNDPETQRSNNPNAPHPVQVHVPATRCGRGRGREGRGRSDTGSVSCFFGFVWVYIRRDEATRGTGTGTDIETLDDWNGDLRDWATRGSNK